MTFMDYLRCESSPSLAAAYKALGHLPPDASAYGRPNWILHTRFCIRIVMAERGAPILTLPVPE